MGDRSRVESRAVLQPQRRIPASSTKLTLKQETDGDVVYLSMGTPGGREVFVQPHLVVPKPKDVEPAKEPAKAQKADEDMFVSYFWAVPIASGSASGGQVDKGNMQVVFETIKVAHMDVNVPIMTNTAPLDAGDRLIVEPYNKKPKRG